MGKIKIKPLANIVLVYNGVRGYGDLPVLSFSVHPNPASSTVYVTMATAGNALITVHDVWGREVFTTLIQPGRGRVDVAALCSGVYFLSLLQNGGAVTRKVVVR